MAMEMKTKATKATKVTKAVNATLRRPPRAQCSAPKLKLAVPKGKTASRKAQTPAIVNNGGSDAATSTATTAVPLEVDDAGCGRSSGRKVIKRDATASGSAATNATESKDLTVRLYCGDVVTVLRSRPSSAAGDDDAETSTPNTTTTMASKPTKRPRKGRGQRTSTGPPAKSTASKARIAKKGGITKPASKTARGRSTSAKVSRPRVTTEMIISPPLFVDPTHASDLVKIRKLAGGKPTQLTFRAAPKVGGLERKEINDDLKLLMSRMKDLSEDMRETVAEERLEQYSVRRARKEHVFFRPAQS